MPTRFKYTKTQEQYFALTPVEILLATDAELNQYMSLKKYAPYRKDGSNWDKNRASRLQEFKQKVKKRGAAIGAGADLAKVLPEKPAKKRKGKKERMKLKAVAEGAVDGSEGGDVEGGDEKNLRAGSKRIRVEDGTERSKKRKRRKHKESTSQVSVGT